MVWLLPSHPSEVARCAGTEDYQSHPLLCSGSKGLAWVLLSLRDLILPLVLLYSKGYQLGHVPCSDHFTIQEGAMTRPRHILSSLTCAGLLILTLSGCSITETINNFLSSTSGRSWFTEDGLVKADHRVNAFMTLNFENLKQDMAQGHGEYLASLSTLMNIPQDRQASFFAHAQSRYPFVMEHQSSPEEVIALLVEKPTTTALR
jgi:hypothetical protein